MYNYSKIKWSLALCVAVALCISSGLLVGAGLKMPQDKVRGQAAIEALGGRLPAVAARYGKSAEKLRELFLQNSDLWIDPAESLFYSCGYELSDQALAVQKMEPPLAESIVPLDQTFKLHSLAGSLRVIHLDFDGHVTSGTIWNSNFNGGADIVSVPYDFDGNTSSFSSSELDRIQNIWARVAEDFAIYDVDVTTEDPGSSALRRTNTSGDKYGIRMVISPSSGWYSANVGGIAYVGSFNWTTDTPAFVFSNRLGNGNEKYTSENTSHEAGHSVGLHHDGKTDGTQYYRGHGDWAPIMGNSYYNPITQWSKGEYAGANNQEDDLAIMPTRGAQYVSDDHGGTNGTASSIVLGSGGIDATGIIEKRTDTDVFSFLAGSGSISISIDPAEPAGNLDISVYLEDTSGAIIASSNPSGLPASLNTTLAGGTYYLHVQGVGTGDPSTGYSDYASIGQYFITGTITDLEVFDFDVSPTATAEFAGSEGGPFDPSVARYTLSNSGGFSLGWSATESADWLALSQTQGTLSGGDTMTVDAFLTSQASSLPVGIYTETITFIDSSNSVMYDRDVRLEIYTVPDTDSGVLLNDNFDDGNYAGWTIVDEGTNYTPSAWSASSGVMVQNSNIYSGPTSANELSKLGTYAFYDTDSTWTNYRVDMTIRSQDDDAIGVMFRYQDSDNYYRFSLDKSRKYRRLVKKIDGVFTLLAEDSVPYVIGQTYQLRIVVQDALLEVLIDGSSVLSVTDGDLNFGSIGLYMWGNAGSYFDNVLVTLLSGADSSVLLDANFDGGNYAGWTIVDEGTNYVPSAWSASSGVMVQNSNIYGGSTSPSELSKLGTYAFYDAVSTWTNYRVDMTIRSQDDDAIGVMFRYQDSENYYRFSWDKSRKYRRLVKKIDGVFTLLAEDLVPYMVGQTYQLRIIAQDALLEVLIDGSSVLSVTDGDLNFGSIGLYMWGNAGSCFDDVVVTLLSGGNFPPTISSVAATPSSILDTQTCQLQVVADDPDSGPEPLTYYWTVQPGQGTLDEATIANPVYTPPDVTISQVFTLTVEVSDGEGLTSDTVDVTITDIDSSVLLDDNFEDGDYAGWTIVDEGTKQTPSAWSAVSGTMVQSSNIYASPTAGGELSKLGTYAFYDAASTWTNYRIDMTIRSQDDDAIGVMFRYQDSDNYYRFSWDKSRKYRRLVKKTNGVFTLLAEDSVPYVIGQTYQLRIVVQDALLEVLIDGSSVLSVTDGDLNFGSICLYSWGNTGSYFDDVVVTLL